MALADSLDDSGLRVAANFHLGWVNMDRGSYKDAKAIFSHSSAARLEGDIVRERPGMSGDLSVYYCYMLG